jgi:hypothetical protein
MGELSTKKPICAVYRFLINQDVGGG